MFRNAIDRGQAILYGEFGIRILSTDYIGSESTVSAPARSFFIAGNSVSDV